MNIEKPAKPNEKQLQDIQELVRICSIHDGTEAYLDLDDSFKKPEDVNTFLLYRDTKLLSLINLFVMKKLEAELSAFTLPEVRREGLFSGLLKEAEAEVRTRGIESFLYVCNRDSKDGQAALRHMGAAYDFSEYSMVHRNKGGMSSLHPRLLIRRSVPEDSKQLIRLSLLSFDNSQEDAESYVKNILADGNRIQHVAEIDGKIAGMISTAIEDKSLFIHSLCVLPDYRKQGVGGALLDFKIAEAAGLPPGYEVKLEVMTRNTGALSLYEQKGFVIGSCYDYFRKTI